MHFPALRRLLADRSGPRSDFKGYQQMTARIDDEVWVGANPLLVTVQSGLIGIAGFDGGGRGIAIALTLQGMGEEQLVGSSPANAVVTIAGQSWGANCQGGGGFVVLDSLTTDRAVGRFSFTVELDESVGGAATKRVTGGRFEVSL